MLNTNTTQTKGVKLYKELHNSHHKWESGNKVKLQIWSNSSQQKVLWEVQKQFHENLWLQILMQHCVFIYVIGICHWSCSDYTFSHHHQLAIYSNSDTLGLPGSNTLHKLNDCLYSKLTSRLTKSSAIFSGLDFTCLADVAWFSVSDVAFSSPEYGSSSSSFNRTELCSASWAYCCALVEGAPTEKYKCICILVWIKLFLKCEIITKNATSK